MRSLWITAFVVLVDQITKVLVLSTMYRGQSIPLIGDWLRFTFTENPGMAFGISFGPAGLVTVFSVVATILIVAYMVSVRTGYGPYVASMAFILGGAIGNIIDRALYGMLVYGDGLFQGRVVDFIHVNLWRGYIPEVIPVIGGSYIALFPIWNVADMAIVAGVVGILVFQQRFHERRQEVEDERSEAQAATAGSDGSASYSPGVIPVEPLDERRDS
jgi:signal peptidase II